MSRHLLPCNDPELVLWVGWDTGLQTFFAQVEPPGAARPDDLLAWFGTMPEEVRAAADLARLVSRWAVLDRQVVATLESDRSSER